MKAKTKKKQNKNQTFPKYNRKLVETKTKSILPTHIYITVNFHGLVQALQ
jgi:hypothetical protein